MCGVVKKINPILIRIRVGVIKNVCICGLVRKINPILIRIRVGVSKNVGIQSYLSSLYKNKPNVKE